MHGMVCFFKTLPADGGRVPWFFLVKRKPKAPRFGGSQMFPDFQLSGMSQDGSGWIVGDRINGLVGAYIYIYIYSIYIYAYKWDILGLYLVIIHLLTLGFNFQRNIQTYV